MRKASEERKAFLEAEMDRIRAQEERLRKLKEEMKGDWVAELSAIAMANNQLAKLDSMLPAGALGSWALETSAACSCQGACSCIKKISMTVERVGEDPVELTLQPDLLKKERKEERKEERPMDRKARVAEAKITLAEVSLNMKRAVAAKEWGVLESLKNQWNPAWKILMREEPECGWEAKWYAMNVDASLHLGRAMLTLRRFGVVEQVVGGPDTMAKVPPKPDDLGWSPERVAQWFLLRASSRLEQNNLGGVEYDLEEVEKLAKRAIDRWGRRMLVEVERLWKVVRGRKDRRRGRQ